MIGYCAKDTVILASVTQPQPMTSALAILGSRDAGRGSAQFADTMHASDLVMRRREEAKPGQILSGHDNPKSVPRVTDR